MTENRPNLILLFIKHYRLNEYFLAEAKAELELALKLGEYLNPDPMSRFEPNKEIRNKLLSPNENIQMEAVDLLRDQLDIEFRSPEKIRETLAYLIPIYLETKATEKDKKRRKLQAELKKLDEEEKYVFKKTSNGM